MELIYGLIGEKLQHSLSPQIHTHIYRELNLDASYKLFEVSKGSLKDALLDMKHANIKGANITIPYKVEVMQYIDKLSPEAQKIGSVNTIAFGESLIGYNTDYFGFSSLVAGENIEIKNSRATVLGTGGASRTIVQYLLDNKVADILLVSRTINSEINTYINKCVKSITYDNLSDYKSRDIIINCTPCGMYPDITDCPINPAILQNYNTAIDLIYNPTETFFIRNAKKYKLKVANGLYMLIAQAAAAYKFWDNINIDKSIIEKIYKSL